MKYIVKIVLLSLIVGIFSSCSKTPYTNRKQMVMFSPQQELQMGYQSAQQILKTEHVSNDRRINALVQRVGQRIAKAAAQPGYKWQFFVIDKNELNAFCLPGGKVFVYTGLFKAVENEDQLSVVMGHEVAHAIARHGAERMSMIQLGRMGKQIASKTLGGGKYAQVINQAYGAGETYGMVLPFSRKFEYEADEIGLYLMTQAGYNPNEAVKFWDNMRRLKQGSKNPPEFLSTHPADVNRIKKIKALIPRALQHYK
jgi:predicted Zn-dependent protease